MHTTSFEVFNDDDELGGKGLKLIRPSLGFLVADEWIVFEG